MSSVYSSDSTVDQTSKIPTNIASSGKLSGTSDALTCFREQQFSEKLQVFLVSYVMSVNSYYAVYK
jgi:hypothetical protein